MQGTLGHLVVLFCLIFFQLDVYLLFFLLDYDAVTSPDEQYARAMEISYPIQSQTRLRSKVLSLVVF